MVMEATSDISEITRRSLVATDDELVELLNDHKTGIIFLSVLPSFSGYGVDEDNSGIISFLQFFVLEKTDYSSLKKQDEYIEIFQRTLEAAKKFMNHVYKQNINNCSADELQYDFSLRPISRKAQCNGWEIQIDSRAYYDLL